MDPPLKGSFHKIKLSLRPAVFLLMDEMSFCLVLVMSLIVT